MSLMTIVKYSILCNNHKNHIGKEYIMTIHHLRNATFIIESKERFILVDPMLGAKGSLPPFSRIKHKAQHNPLVELPSTAKGLLSKVTHTLITHSQKWGIEALTHTDHFDSAGKNFLQKNQVPVATLKNDTPYMKKHNINVTTKLTYWDKKPFLDGYITAVPAKHGHGFIHKVMANGAGLFLELPNEPSLYISGDTVLTSDVKKALKTFSPDITVVAAGNASIDVGGDILMPIEEVLEFIQLSPKKVIANHLEALNHCPITRSQLKSELTKAKLLEKVSLTNDGESLLFL